MTSDTWFAAALQAIEREAESISVRFLAADLRQLCQERGLVDPPDKRAWGAVMVAACSRGFVRKTGAFALDRFGSPKPLYVRGSEP